MHTHTLSDTQLFVFSNRYKQAHAFPKAVSCARSSALECCHCEREQQREVRGHCCSTIQLSLWTHCNRSCTQTQLQLISHFLPSRYLVYEKKTRAADPNISLDLFKVRIATVAISWAKHTCTKIQYPRVQDDKAKPSSTQHKLQQTSILGWKNSLRITFGMTLNVKTHSSEPPPDWKWDKKESDLNEACLLHFRAKICPSHLSCVWNRYQSFIQSLTHSLWLLANRKLETEICKVVFRFIFAKNQL